MASRRSWWPLLVLVLAGLIPVLPGLSSGKTIGAFDQVAQMAPFSKPAPEAPWDVLQADGVLQFYVWRDLVFDSWRKGELPGWNPYQLAGTPLLANSQSGALYPPHVLAAFAGLSTGLAIVLLAWFHLAVAGVGTYLLARSLGAGRPGALTAGVAFALSPFLIGWISLASVGATCAWIPWAMAAVVRLLTAGTHRRAWALVLALATAMTLLGGHLQFAAFGMMATLTVGLLRFLLGGGYVGRGVRGLLAVGCLALGGALAAPQVLPVLRYSEFSHRRNVPTAEGYAAYRASAIPMSDVAARLLNPISQGNPTERVSDGIPFSSYWPAVARPGANYAESALTVGPVVLGLLFMLPFARPARKDWVPIAVVALLALLLALGTPLAQALYFLVPGWSSTGSPGRAGVLFVLAAAVLAGLAVGAVPTERAKTAVGVGAAGVLLGFAISVLAARPPSEAPGFDPTTWTSYSAYALTAAMPIGLLLVLAGGLATVHALVQDARARAVPALLALLAALVMGAVSLVRTGDPESLSPFPGTGFGARVAIENDAWGLVTAAPALLPPNLATLAGVRELGGYDSLLHRDTVAMMQEVVGQDAAPPANGNIQFVKPGADRQKLAEAGVTELWRREGGQMVRERIPGTGRAEINGRSVAILKDTANTVYLNADGPGRLVLRDRNMPGWTVRVNDRPARLEGTRWREVELPEGKHSVLFRYEPPGLRTGIVAALFAAAALFGIGLWKERPASNVPEQLESEER